MSPARPLPLLTAFIVMFLMVLGSTAVIPGSSEVEETERYTMEEVKTELYPKLRAAGDPTFTDITTAAFGANGGNGHGATGGVGDGQGR